MNPPRNTPTKPKTNWPFPPPGFKHPKPGERLPFNPDNHEDAPL